MNDVRASTPRRGERLLIGGGLLALTLLCWLYLVLLADAMDAMGSSGRRAVAMWLMPMGRWGAAELALCLAMWIVMMVAMMAPSAAPMLFAFHAVSRSRGRDGAVVGPLAAFALGYIAVWSAFSLAATVAQWSLHEASIVTDAMASASRPLDAALLLVAGAFQFAPLKQRCLAQCRSPMGFLLSEWRDGTRGAFLMGLRHGAFCVGCCWGLMLVLIVVGVMNLAWMVALAAAVFLEKVWRHGKAFSVAAGLVLIVFSFFVPWNQGLIPGLHMTGMTGMTM